MKPTIKYIVLLVAIGFIAYKSVYIKKPGAVNDTTQGTFNAAEFSDKLWKDQLPAKLDSAVELHTLVAALEANPSAALARYANATGIGNYRYCLVKLEGVVTAINEDDMIIQAGHADTLLKVKLVTEYVYGNAIRDASGLVDIKSISNSTALNDISAALNKMVRTAVLPDFKKQVKQGSRVAVTGAVEINKEHIRLNTLELIPVRVKILP